MGKIIESIKQLFPIRALLNTVTYRRWRHAITLITDVRPPEKTFTQFLRLPNQYQALAGPVTDFVLESKKQQSLRIIVMACSTGAEVWSLVSSLSSSHPDLDFHVSAYDISDAVISVARRASYSANELFTHDGVSDEFVRDTFDKAGERYEVKPHLREKATFSTLDLFTPGIAEVTGKADILFAQNVLFNFKPSVSRRAFFNLVELLAPRSALFIDGMDPGQRAALTQKFELRPLDFQIEQIHNDARVVRGEGWPYKYWGLEPYSPARRNKRWFYCTIFLKEEML